MDVGVEEGIRVAVLLPASRSSTWQEELAHELSHCADLRVEVLRVHAAEPVDPMWGRWKRGSQVIKEVPAPTVTTEKHDASIRWDVVLDLAGLDQLGSWAAQSRNGVWQPLDAQGLHLAGAFPCQASVCSGGGGELLMVRDRTRVLARVCFYAEANYARSSSHVYAFATVLIRMALQGSDGQVESGSEYVPAPLQAPWRRVLERFEGNLLAWRRKLSAQWLSEGWMIGVLDGPIERVLHMPVASRVKWIGRRTSARYRADPFGVPGQRQIYCETIDNRTGLGRIQAIELNEHDRIVRCNAVKISGSDHMSYPFLFEHEGVLYAIPETSARGCVELYEVSDGHWRLVTKLLENVAAADATLFVRDGLFWMAYTDLAYGPFNNLCMSFAKELSGPWQRHPHHPVKLDHRSSRPAGTPFVHEAVLYRPAQDCRFAYGQALVLNQVIECTPQRYREVPAHHYKPDPKGMNPHGLHTLSAWGDRTLVDGYRLVLNPHELLRKIRRRINNLKEFMRKPARAAAQRGAQP